jgi:DNA excision repair protein ERCC-2
MSLARVRESRSPRTVSVGEAHTVVNAPDTWMDGMRDAVLCSLAPTPTARKLNFMVHFRTAGAVVDPPQPQLKYEVAVRALCEFTAKQGDLDMRFTPSPSAEEGIAGHRVIGARRGVDYETEVSLAADYGPLVVRGRADGYDPHAHQLEEFKTHRGDIGRIPANHRALHWAQLRIYGWLLCRARDFSEIRLALVYFDIATEEERVLVEMQSARTLQEHFAQHCQRFLDWSESEASHRLLRDRALQALHFPHATFHAGQRQLAEAVYRNVMNGRALLVQAPTGSGKTIGTMFPALKAMPAARVDKLIYLVAKTSGRRLALDVLRDFNAPGGRLPVRILELVARKKACEYPDNTCDGAGCPLARGFYDRLPAARAAALALGTLDQRCVRELALRHAICPYYLGQELARWSDVIVGDYNYYFDVNAMLYGWTAAEGWRICVQVDEAHNLIERARKMYTVALDRFAFDAARRRAPAALKKAFAGVSSAWRQLVKAQDERYRVYESVPAALLSALQEFIVAVAEYCSAFPASRADELQDVFFDAVRFCRLAGTFDSATLFEITKTGAAVPASSSDQHSVICLRNILPRRFLAPRFAAAHAAVLFSATLAPPDFYVNVLGLQQGTDKLDVGSPFDREQLTVKLVPSISTRYRDRGRSLGPIAHLIAEQYAAQPGNYLAFFSSFEYMNAAAARVAARYPAIPLWAQGPQMAEPEREAFLARFVVDGRGVGFAVLGGAFAEAVDLPGSRLVGAFIATLGLPPVNAVNGEIERRMSAIFGTGYEYTYLYPGVQKVIQAAGRVIRAAADRGVLYLIDDRFARWEVRRLLPTWWRINTVACG